MNRLLAIGAVCVLALVGASTMADDYVEDVYYWQDSRVRDANTPLVPTYNKHVKEIIFIEDSTTAAHPDTVRAVIRTVQPSDYNRDR